VEKKIIEKEFLLRKKINKKVHSPHLESDFAGGCALYNLRGYWAVKSSWL